MKRVVLLLALAVFVFVSCEKDPKSKLLDPNAKISIYPAVGVKASAKADAAYPTALEIVQQTTDIAMHSPDYPNEPYVNVGISDEQKDTEKLRIMMWGDWIIREGKLVTAFIEAYDVVFLKRELINGIWKFTDTVAYIPNESLRTAEKAIKSAYTQQDYEQVYKLFDEVYRFTPINGEDWRKLKAVDAN